MVVWGMDRAHHILNNQVIPNVVSFVASLPWRLLMVVFPTLSISPESSDGSTSVKRGRRVNSGAGLAARLEHLKMIPNSPKGGPVTRSSARSVERSLSNSRGGGSPRQGGEASPRITRPQASRLPTEDSSSGMAKREGESDAEGSPRYGSPACTAEADRQVDGNATIMESDPADGGIYKTPRRNGDASHPGGTPGTSSRKASPGRRSFGEMVRSAITGDFNVRVRDHLFDLKTASPPPVVLHAAAASAKTNTTTTIETAPTEHDRQISSASSVATVDDGRSSELRKGRRNGRVPSELSKDEGASSGAARSISADDIVKPRGNTNKLKKSGTTPSTRHPTRRRPSEFSTETSAEEGAGGGDAAAGVASMRTPGDSSRGEIRRRNAASRRSTPSPTAEISASTGFSSVRTTAASRALTSAAGRGGNVYRRGAVGAEAGDRTLASAAAAPTAGQVSRAARLSEWRRKRAEQVDAQERERARRSGTTTNQAGSGVSRTQSGIGPGDLGSGGGGGGAKLAGAATRAGKRRFRHVERFRSEVGGVADAGPAAAGGGGSTGEETNRSRPRPVR